MDNVEKREFLILPGLKLQPLGRQARRHLKSYTVAIPTALLRLLALRYVRPRNLLGLYKYLLQDFQAIYRFYFCILYEWTLCNKT
jgi:hypothetical protein